MNSSIPPGGNRPVDPPSTPQKERKKKRSIEEEVETAAQSTLNAPETASQPTIRKHKISPQGDDYETMEMDESDDTLESPAQTRKTAREDDEADINVRTEKRGKSSLQTYDAPGGLGLRLTPEAAEKITDEEFAHLIGELPPCVELTIPKAKCITDAGIIRAIMGNSALCALHLESCGNVKDWALQVAAKECPNLRTLSLVSCSSVTDDGVAAVAKRLQELHLDRSSRLTNQLLRILGKSCPELEILSIQESFQYSLEAMQALLRGCQKLRELDLSFCPQVDDGWIEAIIECCPNLEKLTLQKCHRVTGQAIDRLHERYGNQLAVVID